MKRYIAILIGLAVAGLAASQESRAGDAKQLQHTCQQGAVAAGADQPGETAPRPMASHQSSMKDE